MNDSTGEREVAIATAKLIQACGGIDGKGCTEYGASLLALNALAEAGLASDLTPEELALEAFPDAFGQSNSGEPASEETP